MRATRLPIPVLQTAMCRRSLAALIAIALMFAAPAPIPAIELHGSQWIAEYSQLLLGQADPAKDPAKNETSDKSQPPRPTIGRSRRPSTKTGAAAPVKKDTAIDPVLQRDKTALPDNYKVPPEPLPDLKAFKEIPFPKKPGPKPDSKDENFQEKLKAWQDQDKAWREHTKKFKEYRELLTKGSLRDSRADREILRYGIKHWLAQMTQKSILFVTDEDREKIKKAQAEEKKIIEEPETIEHLRDQLLTDLKKTGQALSGGMEVRDAYIDVLCEEAPKLLDNNFYVRFNVAEILCSINNRDADATKGIVEEPGFKALKALLGLVNDSKQHPLYKLHPVQALARLCRHKNCKTDDRFAIIESLLNQMTAAKKLPEWYGMRVAESLGQLGEPYDRTRQPVVVEALVNVLKDDGYTYRVRVEAGHSLGRVPLEGYRKSDEIAVELLRLAGEMATDYQKEMKSPRWRLYFALVYFSFQPADQTERAEKKGLLGQVDSKPVLAGTKTVVMEAYQLFLPLAQNVLGGNAEGNINDQLRKIKPWLDAHSKGPGNGNPVAAGRD